MCFSVPLGRHVLSMHNRTAGITFHIPEELNHGVKAFEISGMARLV